MNKLISLAFLLIVLLVGCTSYYRDSQFNKAYGPVQAIDRRVTAIPPGDISFYNDVRPILERRCDVCHSCYDAPCQVKLTSFEGIDRGGSKSMVYASRVLRTTPTRLFIDADSIGEWRQLEFHPILNERNQTPKANVQNSLISLMLELKKDHPQPISDLLPSTFDIGLDKEGACTTAENFVDYKEKYPLWGMPYALPGLTADEHKVLTEWIEQGAKITPRPEPAQKSVTLITEWENYFNRDSLKEQLVSRYIYEHLFMAHIHFKSLGDREFYRMVRSSTPSGEPIIELNTDRPYDDPGPIKFYYRLRPVVSTIVAKNHTVYTIDETTMDRYNELFFEAKYKVTSLPGYEVGYASNPFKVFREIPAKSRYKFMLDNAKYTIEGFIKGPVCRGQIALNVINDHFFVSFINPDKVTVSDDTAFLDRVSDNLALPTSVESTIRLVSLWYEFNSKQQEYLTAKEEHEQGIFPDNKGWDLSYIWDGDGHKNDNALLTVFRHFDSASVVKGFIGENPKTGWVIDYPMLERIHYLLVAGFNIFGNVGHQLQTRLYMDYLRIEGENNLLKFLPQDKRIAIRSNWYQDTKDEYQEEFEMGLHGMKLETNVEFSTDNPKIEFFSMMKKHVNIPIKEHTSLGGCPDGICPGTTSNPFERKADKAFWKIAQLRGKQVQLVPDVCFVHITTGNDKTDLIYTVIRNKALSNNSFLLDEERRRVIENDTLTVVKGYIGSYPNSFVKVDIDEVESFAEELVKLRDPIGYFNLASKYVARRTSPDFWTESDWHNQNFLKEDPVEAGLFDLYRYHRISEMFEVEFKW
ncbi:fatty acid cis/trans isomerase [Maridesulfovibrio frigidus]|uniref:fatty acid cis/trans isomerase n=1 Tax=Maridesulfovibrio frigidus TaxID=340956 RepID=UPI0004E182B5|nr:fatty acid cis/trans isomerase [Maridesulfovibrio frigidus]